MGIFPNGLGDTPGLFPSRRIRKLSLHAGNKQKASKITLPPDNHGGYINAIEPSERVLIVDGIWTRVQDDAVIMDLRGDGDKLRDFSFITHGDQVNCFGLDACSADTENDFYAFAILIIED